MKKINWPIVKKPTPAERIWLEEVYTWIKNHEYPDYRKIKTKLLKKLPERFNPSHIDSRVGGYKGTNLTLLGIYTIDPKSKLIDKMNLVINCIRELLIKDSTLTKIKTEDISRRCKLSQAEVGLALKFTGTYGTFWQVATHSKGYGYDEIDIQSNDEIFDNYLDFSSIEDLINNYYKKKEEEAKAEKEKKNPYLINLPIKDFATPFQEDRFYVNPIFTSRITNINKKLCFVLMPFKEEWSDRVYKSYIRENIEALDYQCVRADNLVGKIVIEDIWAQITQAAFIIADVTGKNPNVMYELGIAHTVGKPVILITQDLKTIPFDFAHLRHYEYKDNSDGKELFASELKRIIPEIYKEHYELKLQ